MSSLRATIATPAAKSGGATPSRTPLASVASPALSPSPVSQPTVASRRFRLGAVTCAGWNTAEIAQRNTAAEVANAGATPNIWRALSTKSGEVAVTSAVQAPARRPAKRATSR